MLRQNFDKGVNQYFIAGDLQVMITERYSTAQIENQMNDVLKRMISEGKELITLSEIMDALLNDQKKTKALPIMGTTMCECYNCKHLLAEGMNYCPVCGYEISEAPWKMKLKDGE